MSPAPYWLSDLDYWPSNLSPFDRKALEIGQRIFGIEYLAVEERLLAARRRGWNVGSLDREFLGGGAPDVFAVDLVYEGLHVGLRFELAPADILGDEPKIMALEWIGGVIAPEFHVLFGALLDATVAVIHVALEPADDVGDGHVEPLPLADDGRDFFLVLGLLAPLLRLNHGHQECACGVRIFVDPGGTQAECLFGVLEPDLASSAGGKSNVLVHKLFVPWFA